MEILVGCHLDIFLSEQPLFKLTWIGKAVVCCVLGVPNNA